METASKKLMQKKYIKGQWMTLEETIQQFDRLVWKIAVKYRRQALKSGMDKEDLHSIGVIGLIGAYERFDHTIRDDFAAYAYMTIQGRILHGLRDEGRNNFYPRRIAELAVTMNKHEVHKLSDKAISERYNIDERDVGAAKMLLSGLAYLNDVQKDKDGSESEYESIIGKEQDMTGIYVHEFYNALSPAHRRIVRGLVIGESQSSIGKDLGISQMHVSRQLKQIRKMYEAYEGAD